jgi:hypothetical protein
MTVKSMNDEGGMYCQWFAGSKLQVGWFEAHSVEKVEE